MSLDLARLRAETPGVSHRIHLNNAGAGLAPRVVTDTVIAHLRREAEIGAYEAAAEADARLDGVYDEVASLLGAAPDEIAILESATLAWNAAFAALTAGPAQFRPGDRVLTHRVEYGSNFLVTTLDASSIAMVSLVRLGAVTHSFDQDQRFLNLDFQQGADSVTVQAPANANLAPPGYYMLFIINTAGVPSVAAFVRL